MPNYSLPLFDSLVEQVETSALTAGGLKNSSKWVAKNTRDPKNPYRNWSFDGHEFQIAILDDPNPDQSVIKCAQVGVSEIFVRAALAATAKFSGTHFMYVLPTTGFSRKFSASRIDPVIEASPRLRDRLAAGVSNLELKKIGSSYLHIGGAAADSSAISVPARGLFVDERAFCDDAVLSVLASRLGHHAEDERIVRRFSTPLFPGSDIDHDYRAGDRKQYMAWHPACGQWVVLSFLDDVVLPGFDAELRLLEPSDLFRKGVSIDDAWIKCPHCHAPFSLADLCVPQYRAWVPEVPSARASSFKITPFVLPHLRTPATVLRELKDVYKNRITWQRFALGEPAESSSDQIIKSLLLKSFKVRPPALSEVAGSVIGCDIGKTSHVVVAKAVDDQLHILSMETVRQVVEETFSGVSNHLADRISALYSQTRCVQAVFDAGPDITTPKQLLAQLPDGRAWACYFVRGAGTPELANYRLEEAEGLVKAYRTRVIDWFVGLVNRGKILFPMGSPHEQEVVEHLLALKRVESRTAAGEDAVRWKSTSNDDHWFFACLYAAIAWDLSETVQGRSVVPVGPWMMGRVRMAGVA